MLNVKKAISKEKISCIIPTFNRADMLYRNVKKYADSVSVSTDLFIIDDSFPNHKRLERKKIESLLSGSRVTLRELIIHKQNKGWPISMKEGVEKALNGSYNFFLCLDDDCTILKNCVERYLAVPLQDDQYGHISSHCNYKRWWRDWYPEMIKFYLTIGVAILHSRKFLEKAGNWNCDLSYHNDAEMALRAWKYGFYSAAVYGPFQHRRTGENFKKDDTEKKFSNGKKLEKLYPDLIKVAKNGNLLRRFEFPKSKWKLNLSTLALERLRRRTRHGGIK